MATKTAIVAKTALTATEKGAKKATAILARMLMAKGEDAASINATIDALASFRDVVTQTGNGSGKRISGAASHDYADQAAALVAVFERGAIAKIS